VFARFAPDVETSRPTYARLVLTDRWNSAGPLASIVNLNHPGHYVHWHFFQMSVANVIVIGLLLVVFALAVALPFSGGRRRGSDR